MTTGDKKKVNKGWNYKLTRVIMPIILVLIISFFALSFSTVLALSERNLRLYSENYVNKMESWIAQIIGELQIYRNQLNECADSKEEMLHYLESTDCFHDEYPSGIYIGMEDGTYMDAIGWEPPEEFHVTERPWYLKAEKESEFVFCDPYVDAMYQKMCVSVSSRLNCENQKIIMGADLYLDYANELVHELAKEKYVDGAMFVTTKERIFIADSRSRASGLRLNQSGDFYREINNLLTDDCPGQYKFGALGSRYYANVSKVDSADWYLVTYVKSSTVLSGLYHLTIVMSVIALSAVLFLVISTRKVGKKMNLIQEESDSRKRINGIISGLYKAVGYIDLKEDSFYEVHFDAYIRQILGSNGSATEALDKMANQLTNEIFKDKVKEFSDLHSIRERIHNKNNISMELLGIKSWCRLIFVPADYDRFGELASVLFMVQEIDGEIMSLRNRLEVEETLIECVRILSKTTDIDDAINRFLAIVAAYYEADRAYIFEESDEGTLIYNTYEWCRSGIKAEINNLQGVDKRHISTWYEMFDKYGIVIINNRVKEMDPGSELNQILKTQGVNSLFVVPFPSDLGMAGFIGVDNPKKNRETQILIRSVASFVVESLLKKKYIDELYDLSYRDMLTGLLNRHAYIAEIKRMNAKKEEKVGIVFADINALKMTNDKYGHEEGDRLIKNGAFLLKDKFKDFQYLMYRIGGDEFVVFIKNIEESVFNNAIMELINSMGENPIVSVGEVWLSQCEDTEVQIKEADQMMYQRKREYHKKMDSLSGSVSNK